MPNVSIIVPVYNVEKYLKRCADTLINQTLKDIEIILVDDGSTDNCARICDELQEQDQRIKVIHKKNAGLGFARNSGLEIATGEFIAFVDSDDFVSEDMYEKLYLEVKKENADTCLCGLNRITSAGDVNVFENPLKRNVYRKDRVLQDILVNMLGSAPACFLDDFIGMSVWKGIYSSNIIMKNKVRFCSEREFLSEDIIFNLDYFSWADSVAVIPDALYNYCENQVSLTKSYRADRFAKYKILYFEVLRKAENIGILSLAKLRIDRTFIANSRVCIIQEVMNAGKNERKTALKNICSICSDSVIQEVLKSYPVHQLPIKQRVFSISTKLRMPKILYILVKLNSRN